MVSEQNKKTLERLLVGYNTLPLYKKRLYPGALSAALRQYGKEASSASVFAVFSACLNKTRVFQRWFFPSLVSFSKSRLVSALVILQTLQRTGSLTGEMVQANFNAVVAHNNPDGLAYALVILSRFDLLTGDSAQANFDAVVAHNNPDGLAYVLAKLSSTGLLRGDNAQTNRDTLVKHPHLRGVADALYALNRNGLLRRDNAQANFDLVAVHLDPEGVASALVTLNSTGLLIGNSAQANRAAVVAHQYPHHVAYALYVLNSAGLLRRDNAQANRDAVVAHQYPRGVAIALATLNRAGLLRGARAQATFDSVAITHGDILTHIDTCTIWNRIPVHRLTRDRFEAIMAICHNQTNSAEGRRLFGLYVDRDILGIQAGQPLATAAFNPAQSTHTASVHASVTASAKKLSKLYGTNITGAKVDGVIKDLSNWLMDESGDSLKLNAAKRCLPRLMTPAYFFQDPGARVSIKQLLALAWLAIHDEEKMIGSLDEAQALLIESLYEIQRGGNIDAAGVDDNMPDHPICPSGTFNKIMEKLCGLHNAVELIFITQEGANRKFPLIINETAVTVLQTLAASPAGQKQLVELLAEIKAPNNHHAAEPIWELIRSIVTDKIFDEFKPLFAKGKDSLNFVGLVDCGKFATLTDATLAELESLVVSASPDAGNLTSPHVFFALKSRSAEVQVNSPVIGGLNAP